MRNTLRFVLFSAVLTLSLSTPARAQDEWTVIDHANWPVWMAKGYWDTTSGGRVTIQIADGSGWHVPTRDEGNEVIGALAASGPQIGDTVQPGDVVGVVIMGAPPSPVVVATIAAVLAAFAGTAFGFWLRNRLSSQQATP